MNVADLIHILGRLPGTTPVLLREGEGETAVEATALVLRMVKIQDELDRGVPLRAWAQADAVSGGDLCVVLEPRWPSPDAVAGSGMDDLIP